LVKRTRALATWQMMRLTMIFVWQEKDSSIEEDGNGNLIFLDRLNVDCGTNGAISEFKLVRDGESDPKTEVCARPTCS
jgi:hypothetical protein